jgi:hypothetical protein
MPRSANKSSTSHRGIIIPALRGFEAAFPVLQNPLAEMAVPASSSIQLAVKRWCRRRQSGSRR